MAYQVSQSNKSSVMKIIVIALTTLFISTSDVSASSVDSDCFQVPGSKQTKTASFSSTIRKSASTERETNSKLRGGTPDDVQVVDNLKMDYESYTNKLKMEKWHLTYLYEKVSPSSSALRGITKVKEEYKDLLEKIEKVETNMEEQLTRIATLEDPSEIDSTIIETGGQMEENYIGEIQKLHSNYPKIVMDIGNIDSQTKALMIKMRPYADASDRSSDDSVNIGSDSHSFVSVVDGNNSNSSNVDTDGLDIYDDADAARYLVSLLHLK